MDQQINELRAEIESLRSENEKLRANRWHRPMRVSSPLTTLELWHEMAGENLSGAWWYAWCPCCKRPLDISVSGDAEVSSVDCEAHSSSDAAVT